MALRVEPLHLSMRDADDKMILTSPIHTHTNPLLPRHIVGNDNDCLITLTQIHTHTHTHTHALHTPARTHERTRTHACTTRTHARTQPHTHAHTHTHTHDKISKEKHRRSITTFVFIQKQLHCSLKVIRENRKR